VIGAHRTAIRVRNRAYTELVRRQFGAFGRRSVLELPIRVYGEGRISIGADVVVGTGSWVQALAPAGEIVIGDRTILARACTVSAAARVVLGASVLVAGGVYIADHQHRRDGDAPVRDQGVDDVAPVDIGAGSWIGQNAVVLPGTVLGEGSVVGANAVVRGEFPRRAIVAGVPARLVRTLA